MLLELLEAAPIKATVPTPTLAEENLKRDVFLCTPSIACRFHARVECSECAAVKSIGQCLVLVDFGCRTYGILPVEGRHTPHGVNPEVPPALASAVANSVQGSGIFTDGESVDSASAISAPAATSAVPRSSTNLSAAVGVSLGFNPVRAIDQFLNGIFPESSRLLFQVYHPLEGFFQQEGPKTFRWTGVPRDLLGNTEGLGHLSGALGLAPLLDTSFLECGNSLEPRMAFQGVPKNMEPGKLLDPSLQHIHITPPSKPPSPHQFIRQKSVFFCVKKKNPFSSLL